MADPRTLYTRKFESKDVTALLTSCNVCIEQARRRRGHTHTPADWGIDAIKAVELASSECEECGWSAPPTEKKGK
jgi:hypothetical protein